MVDQESKPSLGDNLRGIATRYTSSVREQAIQNAAAQPAGLNRTASLLEAHAIKFVAPLGERLFTTAANVADRWAPGARKVSPPNRP